MMNTAAALKTLLAAYRKAGKGRSLKVDATHWATLIAVVVSALDWKTLADYVAAVAAFVTRFEAAMVTRAAFLALPPVAPIADDADWLEAVLAAGAEDTHRDTVTAAYMAAFRCTRCAGTGRDCGACNGTGAHPELTTEEQQAVCARHDRSRQSRREYARANADFA